MSANRSGLAEDLERMAMELATGAADRVRSAREGPLEVTTKSTETDLVTTADRDSEQWLIEQITHRRPGDSVLGEEGGEHVTGPERTGVRWVVDPIDGTVNFVLGLPNYAVSVAAEVDGAVVAGAVCQASSGELFHARVGGGAYLGSMRLQGPRDVPLEQAVIGTGFGYDVRLRGRQAAVAARLLVQVADIRRLGSASLDLCAVAAGHLDGYYEAGLSPWDHAAAGLIAAEAGCGVTGLRGRGPGAQLVVAAAEPLLGRLTALLEALGADEVTEVPEVTG